MSTEVSTPSQPSNTGMKNQVEIQKSCVDCDKTACKTVSMPPTRETPWPELSQQIKTMTLLLQPLTKPRQVQNQQARDPETVLPCL